MPRRAGRFATFDRHPYSRNVLGADSIPSYSMPNDLKGWCRARPPRIAFLIQNGDGADVALDAIFANSYGRWGGRFSLIVPCVDGRIASGYWPWLEVFDPDVVYSYVPLSRSDILELHERLYPSEYLFHSLRRAAVRTGEDIPNPKPSFRVTALSSLSTIFQLARVRLPFGAASEIRIIDSWQTERPSRYLKDNFGTYSESHGGIYPHDAAGAASLLTIVSPEHQADHRLVPTDLQMIPCEMHAFREFANRRATSLSILSASFAPRLEVVSHRWSNSFNLVVGNSFEDRILFWNARLLIPAWLDRDICCFRVDVDQLQDPIFLAILGDLIKQRNHVNTGAGGVPRLKISSLSLGLNELTDATEVIKSTGAWSWAESDSVANLDAVVPSSEELHQARETIRYGDPFPRRNWVGFRWSPPTVRPPTIAPDHLEYAPPRHIFTGGFWSSDFGFQYDGPGRYPGGDNSWVLSRRWRMAGAFQISWEDDKDIRLPSARRNRHGDLTYFVSAVRPIASIKIPTAQEAFQHALALDGMWTKLDGEHGECQPSHKALWIEPSNEGRYLTGILGMAGSLQRASQFLLHPFLREMFAKLGGSPRISSEMAQPTLNRIGRLAEQHRIFDLRSDREKEALADLIVKAAQSLKNPTSSVSYDDLKNCWSKYREGYWAARPEQERDEPRAGLDKLEEASLDSCLVELRRGQMIFQGHEWTCGKCHHKNWLDLGSLGTELSCEVCKTRTQTPVNIGWLFRPNEFLIESLRDHSVLSLVWVLAALRFRVSQSLVFVGPTKFGFSATTYKSNAEADLLALLDGQAILCEVKSSWRNLRKVHIQDFVALAKRIRPDKVLVAVMEKGTPPPELAEAESELATERIGFELLTPEDFDGSDDSFLPSTGEA